MELLFFDTSALVKRYYQEAGTDEVDELIDDERTVVISSLAVIEAISAFKRKLNAGELSEIELHELLSTFFQEALDDFVMLPLDDSPLELAFELVLDEDLRTLDSLQLAAALGIETDDSTVVFVSADRNLVNSAEKRALDTRCPGG